MILKSKDIFDVKKLAKIAANMAALNISVIAFGFPGSGKSTFVKAICNANKKFETLDEEEILSKEDERKLMAKSKKLWCVSH